MTAIAPVVAPLGTLVVMLVVVDDVTEPAVPLNVTEFWLAVALNPIPQSVTTVPIGAPLGVNTKIATEPRESEADGLLASLMPAN